MMKQTQHPGNDFKCMGRCLQSCSCAQAGSAGRIAKIVGVRLPGKYPLPNDITDGVQSTLDMFANDLKLYRIIKNSHDV